MQPTREIKAKETAALGGAIQAMWATTLADDPLRNAGALLSELASTFDPARTKGEHDLLAAYRALNTRQQGALLEVARGMAGHKARRKR